MQQRQDLTVFSDNTVVSGTLVAPGVSPFLAAVLNFPQTSSRWLINTFVEFLLFGKCRINGHTSLSEQYIEESLRGAKEAKNKVVYVSFSQDAKQFGAYFKKTTGIDVSTTLGQEKFEFVDCFHGLFDTKLKNDVSEKSVERFLQTLATQLSAEGRQVIVVENPEFLLASTKLSSMALVKWLHRIQKASSGVFVVSEIAEPLVAFHASAGTLQRKFTAYTSLLLHRSHVNLTVKPLDTGHASDISGELVVAKGLVPLEELGAGVRVKENEYLFYVRKDSVDLFYR